MGLLGYWLISATSEENDDWERSSTRTYLAGVSTDLDENQVRTALPFAINQLHPSDNGQVITTLSVRLQKDGEDGSSYFVNPTNPLDSNNNTACYYWIVECNYGAWHPLEHTANGDPTQQPITYGFQWQVYEQAVDVAIVGKNSDGSYQYAPCVNSANVPFDPPVITEQLKGIITISQNVLTFNPANYFGNGNTINTLTWNGFAPYTVKLTPPSMPERLYSQTLGTVYFRLDYEFSFNPLGWNAQPLDLSYTELGPGGEPVKITDLNGQPVSEPCLLDGKGNKLLNPTPQTIYRFNYQIYTDIDFNTVYPKFSNLFN